MEVVKAPSYNVPMYKTEYDTNGNGIVDNSEKLNGQLPSYYATASHRHTVLTCTMTTTWTGTSAPYTQTITVSGVASTDNPIICPVYSATNATAILEKKAWNMVGKIVTGTNSITITCFEEKPTQAVNLQIKLV